MSTTSDDIILWQYVETVDLLYMIENQILPTNLASGHLETGDYFPGEEKIENLASRCWRHIVECVSISEWYSNSYESRAMWERNSEKPLALKTSLTALNNSLSNSATNLEIRNVHYEDWNDFSFELERNGSNYTRTSLFDIFKYKSMNYDCEDAVRVITTPSDLFSKRDDDFSYSDVADLDDPIPRTDIDFPEMVDEVIVSPYASNYIFPVLTDYLTSEYGVSSLLTKSSL
ncbi:hypothetical protein SAMN05421858_4821 [Haladaptatus litoreus]|uniref:Uncharacterized protein n=1 Tax=Haladaptatus litoreus TaxID=553468 RepID=A0A1N7F8L7_9EURY|nr:hypothetical protein [Haladaptatus litoreus]SIR96691.1 hypothetical protein SAMN05421858_4821 [Haladaptatus litoreus]